MVSNSEIFPNTLRNWTTRYPKVCQILLYPSCSKNHPSICPMSQRCKPPLQSGKKRSRMPSWPNFFSNQKKQHSTETTHRYQTIAIFKRELPFPNHHFGYPAVRFRENNLLIVFHVRSCFFFFSGGGRTLRVEYQEHMLEDARFNGVGKLNRVRIANGGFRVPPVHCV